jgi:hypothetical protein
MLNPLKYKLVIFTPLDVNRLMPYGQKTHHAYTFLLTYMPASWRSKSYSPAGFNVSKKDSNRVSTLPVDTVINSKFILHFFKFNLTLILQKESFS